MRDLDNFRQAVESLRSWNSLGYICLKTTFLHLKHLTDLSNITFNWLLVWKMTWGIWQIFTRALESLKIGILMGSFIPKLRKYELKIHRRVICHDNEDWGKIWRGLDLSFQSWHEEFDEFWSEHFKVPKIFILICSFWAKYVLFELKKMQRS